MAIPQPQKDKMLRKLSEVVSCSEEYRRDALQLIEQVRAIMSSVIANSYGSKSSGRLRQLRPDFVFSLSESIIGGGFEKRTEVLAPDVDVVFRLNGVTPPDEKFPAILRYFKGFLRTATQLPIIRGSIKTTDFSVGFTSYSGIEFDLLPATSITNPKDVYQKMKEVGNNWRYYRTSLAEKQKEFMKEQSAFVHAVARLAKLWYKSIYFEQHAAAGGTFMELISVAASMITRDENGSESCFRTFWKTLEMIKDHHNLRLAFVRDAVGNWRIDGRLLQRSKYVIDPSNPSDNFLDHDRVKNAMGKLQQAAQVTLERLRRWNSSDITLLELFEPQPLNVESSLINDGGIIPDTIYVCHTKIGRKTRQVDVRNPRVLELRQLRKFLEVLKMRVHALLVCDVKKRRRVGAQGDFPEFVKENIRKWLSTANVITNPAIKLKTFDVTMSFGLGKGRALRVSMKWRDNLSI